MPMPGQAQKTPEEELKEAFEELVQVVEDLLNDPEVQQAIPQKYRWIIKIALKIVKAVAKMVLS